MGLLSNRVDKGCLKPGDHIYSWRTAYIYAHHGIYVGDDTVVHFTRRGQEVGTGTMLDALLVSSGPARPQQPCQVCTPREEGSGVLSSCLNCFLAGGVLYRFEYAVNPALFIAKARGGTCTLAVSDPDDVVVHRAKYLLDNGFGIIGQSGQTVSIIGGPLAAVLSTPLRLVTTNVYGMAATAITMYCASRYAADIGMRRDVVKVSVEDMTSKLATGLLRVAEAQIVLAPIIGSSNLVTQ
ncbi:PREDICTED: NC domain-containing [Prunus dulcis]|uniref:PREDICTED: NC domain-containing n=1 Tax=Prunus dulcis TaxID=3755 RepID=A0A5E4EK45_PRUDU|nr:PREDICTED: NC domain-containing [Prunus dulcis]